MVRKTERDTRFFTIPGASESYKVAGGAVRDVMLESGLEPAMLSKVWTLADNDKDGYLDDEEFALLCFLLDQGRTGEAIPDSLPAHMLPPKQRR
jgi:hypothetical protein